MPRPEVITAPIFNPSDVAARCLPRDGQVLLNHSGKEGNYQPLREFLLDNGGNPLDVNRILTEDGKWKLRSEHDQSIYQQSPEVIQRYLRILHRPLTNQLIDLSLNVAHETGFNTHGEAHAERITAIMRALTRARGEGEYEERQDVITGKKHDLFCLMSRVAHPEGAVLLMDLMNPSIASDPLQREIIANALRWHDGDVLRHLLRSYGEINSDERAEVMRQRVHPLLLKLIFADKWGDYGRARLGYKLAGKEAPHRLEQDSHAEDNFLWETEEIVLSEDKRKLVVVMKYRPDMTEEEAERFPYLWLPSSKHNGKKARVPQSIRDVYRGPERVDEFSIAQGNFWEHALIRTTPATEAAFALLPIDIFKVVFYDGERLDRKGATPQELMKNGINIADFGADAIDGNVDSVNFIRGRIHNQINRLITKHMPKEKFQGVTSRELFFVDEAA